MGSLQSAIDELKLVDTGEMFDDELSDALIDLSRHISSLGATRLRLLSDFEARGLYERDGHLSATAWLKHRCRMPGGRAAEQVRLAQALTDMPATQRAFTEGEIDYSAVRLLADVHRVHPDEFAQHERTLVDAARSLGARPLRMAVAYWRQALDEAAALEDTNDMHARRRLHVSGTFQGMVRLDGDLDAEGGEIVMTALRSITDPQGRDSDERSPAQRRADALVEVCPRWLDDGRTGTAGGQKPHLSVIVDLEVLEGRAPGISELGDTLSTPRRPAGLRAMPASAGS